MNAFICIDVSFDRTLELGAYAYWIACDATKISLCAPVRGVRRFRDAEILGIYHSLVALQQSSVTGIDTVIIYTKVDWEKTAIDRKAQCSVLLEEIKYSKRVGGFEFRPLTREGRIDPVNQDRIAWCVQMSEKLLKELSESKP